eukprot:7628146-Ditylum_brightwellii.AAC.1
MGIHHPCPNIVSAFTIIGDRWEKGKKGSDIEDDPCCSSVVPSIDEDHDTPVPFNIPTATPLATPTTTPSKAPSIKLTIMGIGEKK